MLCGQLKKDNAAQSEDAWTAPGEPLWVLRCG
jgi:hypothetical protein